MDRYFEEMIAYLKLAQAYKARSMPMERNKALVLAAVAADMLQMDPMAEFCRKLVLQNNSGHMLRKYNSFADAVNDSDFGVFVKQLRRKIPFESVSGLLSQLEYHCPVRKSEFATQSEYAAAIMGVDVDWIKENFSF